MAGTSPISLHTLLQRGYLALENKDWLQADDNFSQALLLDGECAEAYFGRVLAEQQCSSVEEFIRSHQRSGELMRATLPACEAEPERIDAVVKKYQIPGFFPSQDIQELFNGISNTYPSVTAAWKTRIEEEQSFWRYTTFLCRAVRWAEGDFALTLRTAREQIFSALQSELELSENRDWERAEKTAVDYARRLDSAEQEVVRQYEEIYTRLETDYAKARNLEDTAQSEDDFQQAAVLFNDLDGYRDSADRASQCLSRAAAIVNAQRRKPFEQEREALQIELDGLKGLFTRNRRREIETRLAELSEILQQIS